MQHRNLQISIVVGGQWHAFDLAREFYRQGNLHRLITTYPKSRTRKFNIPDAKVVSLPLSLFLHKSLEYMGGEQLTNKFQYFNCQLFAQLAWRYLQCSDIIQGWSSFCEPAIHWAKSAHIPFVVYRGSAHIQVQNHLLKAEYQKLGLSWPGTHPETIKQELREYQLADYICVPSSFVQASFISRGFPHNRLFCNLLGADLGKFYPLEEQPNLPNFRVIYAGSLTVRKGIHYLIKGFQQADIPGSQLYLVGGITPETHFLLGKKDDRVHCTGQLPQAELANYYHKSSVFVMPSIEEGMATVQAQALACGLPLVCTTNTGGEDLLRLSGVAPRKIENGIREYPAGYVVPVGDSQAIATCLTLLAGNPEYYANKRAAALMLRENNLSWQNCAQRATDFYKSLA